MCTASADWWAACRWAIQLAVGWVALVSRAEIAAELAADLYFLSTSQRDAPARHRSLASGDRAIMAAAEPG